MTRTVIELAERPGPGRLGRHIEHDERSRAFSVGSKPSLRTVLWQRRSPILNQGDLGSCCGNAMAGAIGTDSEGRTGRSDISESTGVALYEQATRLDSIPGHYKPTDTGSSGIAAAKAAKKAGFITGYMHAFSLQAALTAIQHGSAIVGMSWLTDMDEPDGDGLVRYSGYIRGGHEVELLGCDVLHRTVTFANSWGTGWGKNGFFSMSWDDFGQALRQGGDVTVPVW